jgi:hypothetical protein
VAEPLNPQRQCNSLTNNDLWLGILVVVSPKRKTHELAPVSRPRQRIENLTLPCVIGVVFPCSRTTGTSNGRERLITKLAVFSLIRTPIFPFQLLNNSNGTYQRASAWLRTLDEWPEVFFISTEEPNQRGYWLAQDLGSALWLVNLFGGTRSEARSPRFTRPELTICPCRRGFLFSSQLFIPPWPLLRVSAEPGAATNGS